MLNFQNQQAGPYIHELAASVIANWSDNEANMSATFQHSNLDKNLKVSRLFSANSSAIIQA